jgi:type 1 glutamine amidotransferase
MKRITALICLVTVAFAANAQRGGQFRALLFTKTMGWYHYSIHSGVDAIQGLAARHTFSVDWQENASVFTEERLKNYNVVIFLNTTGDILDNEQQAAFEKYIQNGGGWVGVHSAADTEYDWEWYTKMLGMMFRTHPREQTAMLDIIDRNFPGMERWADRQIWTDEWYQYRQPALADDLNYLIKVDESTYDPSRKLRDGSTTEGMGDFHPIAWYHEFDGGRAFYTGLGHKDDIYKDQAYLDHLYGGIYWAATGKGLKK